MPPHDTDTDTDRTVETDPAATPTPAPEDRTYVEMRVPLDRAEDAATVLDWVSLTQDDRVLDEFGEGAKSFAARLHAAIREAEEARDADGEV